VPISLCIDSKIITSRISSTKPPADAGAGRRTLRTAGESTGCAAGRPGNSPDESTTCP